MATQTEVKEIDLSDLVLVAYLVLKGFEISKPPFTRHKQAYFTFKFTPELEKAYTEYLNGPVTLNPVQFVDSFNKIRGMAQDLRAMAKKLGHDVGGERNE